jgi:hypothetical protein
MKIEIQLEEKKLFLNILLLEHIYMIQKLKVYLEILCIVKDGIEKLQQVQYHID